MKTNPSTKRTATKAESLGIRITASNVKTVNARTISSHLSGFRAGTLFIFFYWVLTKNKGRGVLHECFIDWMGFF